MKASMHLLLCIDLSWYAEPNEGRESIPQSSEHMMTACKNGLLPKAALSIPSLESMQGLSAAAAQPSLYDQ